MIRDLSRSYEFSSGVSKLDGSKEIVSVRVYEDNAVSSHDYG